MWRRANVSEGARTSGCTGESYHRSSLVARTLRTKQGGPRSSRRPYGPSRAVLARRDDLTDQAGRSSLVATTLRTKQGGPRSSRRPYGPSRAVLARRDDLPTSRGQSRFEDRQVALREVP